MQKNDRYLDPDSIADQETVSPEEISSHSSLLTNRRLDVMFARLDEIRVDAWSNTCIPNLRSYFSILSGIYNNVYSLFELNDNQKIKQYFDYYHTLFFKLFGDSEEVNKFQVCYVILLLLDQIQRIIIGCLQQKRFFFRLDKPQIKGIKQALDLYEKKYLDDKDGRTKNMDGSEHNTPGKIKEAIPESNKPVPKELP